MDRVPCCPTCGQPLPQSREPVPCFICSRPVYRQISPEETFVVCSDTCLAKYILDNVTICDQCGRRFDKAKDRGRYEELQYRDPEGSLLEFCSRECRERHAAGRR
jgi:hypothetical protein